MQHNNNLIFVNIPVSCPYFNCVILVQFPLLSNSSASISTEKRPVFSKVPLDEYEKDKSIVILFYFIIRGNLPLQKCSIKPVNYEAVRHVF